MTFQQHSGSPFEIKISFHKVMESLEEIALSDVDYRSNYAKGLLEAVRPFPELRDGITDVSILKKHAGLIKNLLADLFPTALTNNEIKAAAIPFYNITFNYSERFRKILGQAGNNFDMSIRGFDEHQFYVFCCCLILNDYYGSHLDFNMPLFHDIPDDEGITRHYRIMYNADFLEILPTERSVPITPEDVSLLIDNFDNMELWKQKFPPGSWILKGFGIMSLYDSTTESAISNLKSNLLTKEETKEITKNNLEKIFRSIYKIPDLQTGFTEISLEDNQFRLAPFKDMKSHILHNQKELDCDTALCSSALSSKLLKNHEYFIISDVVAYINYNPADSRFAEFLLSQNIKSCIFAPIIKNNKLLGFVELVSSRPGELNSINANKLGFILPYITDTIDRYYSELQNEIDAIIQKEYTAIHHSVYWKFRDEALLHIRDRNKDLAFKEIVFSDVYPLYGQIDVKGSSTARNRSIEEDLIAQIEMLLSLFRFIHKAEPLPLIEQNIYELEKLEVQLNDELKADTEAIIQNYIENEIHPVLKHFDSSDEKVHKRISKYFESLEPRLKAVYNSRKNFDETLSAINKKMAAILDRKQVEAQSFFPHYYERFKTDGVEHNLYVGASIAPTHTYSPIYLNNLRLWQLQAMCEMENEYFKLRPSLPYDLDVTSLILVFSSPISVRFRMDEKRFDVDGTYNARYEVVKKRIDKSYIKGTSERISEKGKITIVYSQKQEEAEYRRYIRFLQHKNKLGSVIEAFDVEDLQGVTGLKALRVEVVYSVKEKPGETYNYEDLLNELSAGGAK